MTNINTLQGRWGHLIKNAIKAINMSVEVLQTEIAIYREKNIGFDPKFYERKLQIISESSNRIVLYLEFMGGAENFQSAPVDISEFFKVLFHLNRLRLEDLKVDVQYSFKDFSLLPFSNRELFEIFQNLLDNTILHGFSNEKLSGKTISVTGTEIENKIVVEFVDNGTGIPNGLQEKIFEPNYSTSPGGTGVGLTRVREIIRMHNGNITCRSDNGLTRFVIEIIKVK